MKFASLRAEIRTITDNAGKRLLSSAIFAQITRRGVTLANFHVTLGQMCEAKQLTRHALKGKGTAKFEYESGPAPVDMQKEYRPERQRIKGFMALAREREAKERGAA